MDLNFRKWAVDEDYEDKDGAVENFKSYYKRFYKPLLNKIADSGEITKEDTNLLSFLLDDLNYIFLP